MPPVTDLYKYYLALLESNICPVLLEADGIACLSPSGICDASQKTAKVGTAQSGTTGKNAIALSCIHLVTDGWWRLFTPFELMLWPILSRGASLRSVVQSFANLRTLNLCSPLELWEVDLSLTEHALSCLNGLHKRLLCLQKLFIVLRDKYGRLPGADLAELCADDICSLREGLLTVSGLGEESADFILLFALNKPVFALNSTACRVLFRHGFAYEGDSFSDLRELFMVGLPEDTAIYKSFHSCLSALGKNYCKASKAVCTACPLSSFMEYYLDI